uniref:Uncharacterized protein n=1 Tax=Ciona savignyi TaxID=51511 RepID=H2YEX7_CIOSA
MDKLLLSLLLTVALIMLSEDTTAWYRRRSRRRRRWNWRNPNTYPRGNVIKKDPVMTLDEEAAKMNVLDE